MPGAGTDKTKNWVQQPGPVVILVEPQMGENIGSAARAMANFGLARLRLVKPREEWPNPQARKMASGADRILDDAVLYDTLEEAIADCTLVLATTARAHDQAKPVVDAARGGARGRAPGRRGRDRRHPVRPRADRARKPRGRAGRPDRHPAGQSGLRLAQSRPGGGHRRLRVVQASTGPGLPFSHAGQVAAGGEAAVARLLQFARGASWRRSSSSGRPTSATPCRSICATSSPGWR